MRTTGKLLLGLLVLVVVIGLIGNSGGEQSTASIEQGSTSNHQKAPIKDKFWKQIPVDEKFNLTVHDFTGEKKLQIAGFYTLKCLTPPYCSDIPEKNAKEIKKILEHRWPGRKILTVFVAPYGNQYFSPRKFTFTQELDQYDINPLKDVEPKEETFAGGELKDGTVARGHIAIPRGINTSRPYKIWYGEDSVEM